MIKDSKNFLNKIEKIKLFLVKFNKNGIIKNKTYLFDYVIKGENC